MSREKVPEVNMNRIKAIRDALAITQGKLAELLGVTSSFISQAERGDKELSREVLVRLRESAGISIDWFLTGEGGMFLSSRSPEITHRADFEDEAKCKTVSHLDSEAPTGGDRELATPPAEKLSPLRIVERSELEGSSFLVPLLDQAVSAGSGSDLPETDLVAAYIPAPAYLAPYKRDLTALRVSGDSMEPTLRDSDLVVCDTYGWQGDGVYVIQMDGEGFVKRLSRRPGRIVIGSDNPKYNAFEESLESQALRIVGRVRCALKKME